MLPNPVLVKLVPELSALLAELCHAIQEPGKLRIEIARQLVQMGHLAI